MPPEAPTTIEAHDKLIKLLVAQVQKEFDKRWHERDNDSIDKLNKQIEEVLPAAIKKMAEENPNFSLPGCSEKDTGQKFSMAAAICAIRWNNRELAPFECEVMADMEKKFGERWMQVQKDAATAPNTGYIASPDGLAGPHLVPEEHMNEIIELFYAESVAFQLGARGMPGAFGTLTIPVLLSGSAATWSYENTEISEVDPTFGEHTLRPRRLAAAVRMSNMLLTNSRPMADAICRDNLIEQFRVALDDAILQGSGSGANPTGILNATAQMSGEKEAGAVDLSGYGNPWTYALALEFIIDLANQNALRGSLGWAMNPTDWSEAMQMPSGTDAVDVNRIVIQDGAQSRLLGYPIRTTTTLAHGGITSSVEETIIFGDWSQVRVPFWKTLELRATDVGGSTFLRDQTLVRGIMYADVSIDHLESFSIGSTTAG